MSSRREFLRGMASSTAGLMLCGCGFADAAFASAQAGGAPKRREVIVGGQRIRTIDLHTHAYSPEIWELLKSHGGGNPTTEAGETGRLLNLHNIQDHIQQMDERGIDVSALSVNPPNWYWADRDLAREVCRIQNEKMADACAAHPDRLVGFAAVALQHTDLAAEQLEEGVKKMGMRGTLIGGSVNGEELSDPKFHPFWAKAEELGAIVFIHPQSFAEGKARFQGHGWLENIIGNPLETTTALLHLIFEGTLDLFPDIKLLLAHAGGFLPSYVGRADRCASGLVKRCNPVTIKKTPSEYIKKIYHDTLIFNNEGLRHLIAEVGVGQIVLGSDGPGDWNPEAVDFILRAPMLTDSDRKAILGGTAEKLLRVRS